MLEFPSEATYQRCLEVDPSYAPCAINLLAQKSYSDKEVLAIAGPALKKNPLYPVLLERVSGKLSESGKADFLKEWQTRYPDAPDFLQMQAEKAQGEGKIEEALQIYERILTGNYEHQIDVTTDWMNLWFTKATGVQRDPQSRIEYVVDFLVDDLSRPNVDSLVLKADMSTVWLNLAKLIRTELKDPYSYQVLVSQAWQVLPSRDVIEAVMYWNLVDPVWQQEMSAEALRTLPYDPLINCYVADIYWRYLWDPTQVQKLYANAIRYSKSKIEEVEVQDNRSWTALMIGDVAGTQEQIATFRDLPSKQATYYYRLLSAAMMAGNASQANDILEEQRQHLTNPNLPYFARRELALDAQFKTANLSSVVPQLSPQPGTIAVSRDQSRLVVGTTPPMLWDLQTLRPIANLVSSESIRKFSPDGRYLASVSLYNLGNEEKNCSMALHDARTGRLVRSIRVSVANKCTISGLAWSPDSTQISLTNEFGLVHIFNVLTGTVRTTRVSTKSITGETGWAGKYLYVTIDQEDIIHIIDPVSLTEVDTQTGVSWVHAIGVSGDNSTIVFHDNQSRVMVWNVLTDKISSFYLAGSAESIDVNHTGTEAIIMSNFKKTVYRVNLVNGQARLLAEVGDKDWSPTAALLKDGGQVVMSVNSLDLTSPTKNFHIEPLEAIPASLVEISKGIYLLQDKTQEWVVDATQGTVLSAGSNAEATLMTRMPGGLYAWVKNNNILVVRTPQGGNREIPLSFFPQQLTGRWENGSGVIVVGGVPKDPLNGQQNMPDQGIIQIFDVATGAVISKTEFPILTRTPDYPGLYKTAVVGLSLHPIDPVVAWSTEFSVGYGHKIERSDTVSWHSYATKKTSSFRTGDGVNELWFTDTGELGTKAGDTRTYWNVYAGAKVGYATPTTSAIFLAGTSLIRYPEQGAVQRLVGSGGSLASYQDLGNELYLTLSSRGRLGWGRFDGSIPMASLQLFADGTWAGWTDGRQVWGTASPDKLLVHGSQGWANPGAVGSVEGFAATLVRLIGL